MNYQPSTVSKTKIHSQNRDRIILALKALSIVNVILWAGFVAISFEEGFNIFQYLLIEFDLGIILLFTVFLLSFSNPISLVFLGTGFFVASIYLKREAGDDATQILVISAMIPITFLVIILGFISISFVITSPFIFALPLLLIFLGTTLTTNVIFIAIAVPGIFMANFVSSKNRIKTHRLSQPNYLVLLTPLNEKKVVCPFKMQELNGCSYLGYEAPDQELICDYESQWRRCYIYSHIYKNLDEEMKK